MKKIILVLSCSLILLLLVGCYDMSGGLKFNQQGEAEALVGVEAIESLGEEEARIFAWQIDFLFPEVDLNYEKTIERITRDYQRYITISFEQEEKIDLSDSKYFTFEQKNDGSFEFIAEIPKLLDDVSNETKTDVVLSFFVELPKEIDMANSTNVEDEVATWNITKEDLLTETRLRAFTK